MVNTVLYRLVRGYLVIHSHLHRFLCHRSWERAFGVGGSTP
jgi:hypothetical protein